MRMTKVASAAAALLCAAQAPVLAQTQGAPAQAAEGDAEQKVVVTATRRDTTLQSTPLSVSSLSGAQLEDQGITSVGAAVQLVPGVALTNGTPGLQDIVIRGVATSASSQTLLGAITNATTSAYLGEIPISSTVRKTPDFRFVDMDRIEVLRGPQGTLYGQSAMGGVVRYMPNRPDPKAFAGGAATKLSKTDNGGNNYGLDGFVNVPLGRDLALRVVAYGYNSDGYIDVVGTSQVKRANDEDTTGARVALRWTPSARATVDVTALYSQVRTGGPNLISSTYPVDYVSFVPPVVTPVSVDRLVVQHRAPTEEKASVLGVQFGYRFDGMDGTVILSHKDIDSNSSFEPAEIAGLTGAHFGGFAPSNAKTKTIELRLASSGKDRFIDWLVGGYYESTSGLLVSRSISSGNPILLGLFASFAGEVRESGRNVDYGERSLFGEITFNFTPALALTAGYRNASVDNNYSFAYTIGPQPAGRAALVGRSQATSESVDTYRLNLSYKLARDALLYANAASGYRPGGFNAGTSVPVTVPDSVYKSDSLWTYELGVRTTWLDGRLTLNAAAYQTDWRDIQLPTIDLATFYTATRNVGKARIDGLELEAALRATNNLRLAATLTSGSARLSEDAPAAFATAGSRLPGTPRKSATVVADWRSAIGANSRLVANAIYRYVGDRTSGLGATSPLMPGYTQVDLRVGVELANGLDVSLFADNVTNKISVHQVITSAVPGFAYYAVGKPRTVGLAARYRF